MAGTIIRRENVSTCAILSWNCRNSCGVSPWGSWNPAERRDLSRSPQPIAAANRRSRSGAPGRWIASEEFDEPLMDGRVFHDEYRRFFVKIFAAYGEKLVRAFGRIGIESCAVPAQAFPMGGAATPAARFQPFAQVGVRFAECIAPQLGVHVPRQGRTTVV